MRKTFLLLAAGAGALSLAAGAANATPITVTGSVIGTGSLGGDVFTDALVTFKALTDTDDVIGAFQINNIPLDVTVAGLGSAAFTDSMAVVANPNPLAQDIGFGDFSNGFALLFVGGFPGGYDLKSNYTLTGNSIFNVGKTYGTTGGDFSFRSTAETATFTATLGAVPEPAAWALMLAGFAGVGVALRRRRTQVA